MRLLCVQAAVVLAVTVWEIEIFLVIVRLGCTMNQAAAGITSRSTLFGMALVAATVVGLLLYGEPIGLAVAHAQ